jgi:hypothetical protein
MISLRKPSEEIAGMTEEGGKGGRKGGREEERKGKVSVNVKKGAGERERGQAYRESCP